MKLKQIIKQELNVAFAKNAQPIWFRLVKYLLVFVVLYFFASKPLFWLFFFLAAVFSLILHFWYRYKTEQWTKPYGYWTPKISSSNKVR